MSEEIDWRAAASAEYRTKRGDLQKKQKAAAKAEQRAAQRRAELDQQLADLDAGARAFGLEIASPDPAMPAVDPHHAGAEGSAREIILSALAGVYPEGMRAKVLRSVIEKSMGREIHYKTPGMTLYRLAEAHMVRRNGYDWFLTPEGFRALTGQPGLFEADSDHSQASDEENEPNQEYDPAGDIDWERVQLEEDDPMS